MKSFSKSVLALAGQVLTLTGPLASTLLFGCVQPELDPDGDEAQAQDTAEENTAEAAEAITGSFPVVTLGCKFPDVAIPGPISTFGNLVAKDTYPGISHYFRSVSYNKLNLAGSQTYGWFTLPHPKSYYLSNNELDTAKVNPDCLAAADASVYFPSFKSINFVHNGGLGTVWGGGANYTLDGSTKTYGMTFFDYGVSNDAGALVHELGHALGLRHVPVVSEAACGAYSNVYDPMSTHAYNQWLSPGGAYGPYFGVGSRSLAGWIASAKTQTLAAGATTTVYLSRADSGSGFVMAKVPVFNGNYFTVEARRKGGTNWVDGSPSYEAGLANEGAVITWMAPTAGYWEPIMIDADNNCETIGDEGTVFKPGETYVDAAMGTSISVLATYGTGYKLSITAPLALTVDAPDGRVVVSVNGTADRNCDGMGCVYPVAPAKTITLTAVETQPGYTFSGWSGCPSPSGATCTLAPSAATAVTANFAAPFDCYSDCFADCYPAHTASWCSSHCNAVCP